MDYWKECIEEAFCDAKISASPEQVDLVTSWVEGAHDNYGLATGQEIASSNFKASKERELEKALAAADRERNKITCRECNGRGYTIIAYGSRSGESQCWKCDGQGRHDL